MQIIHPCRLSDDWRERTCSEEFRLRYGFSIVHIWSVLYWGRVLCIEWNEL